MGFFKLWWERLYVKLLWKFAKLWEVKPFLKADPNEYCPACGARRGEIRAVTDGTRVTVRHGCKECTYQWDTETVTEIDQRQIIPFVEEPEETEEEEAVRQAKTRRFVKIPFSGKGGVKVNGKELKEKGK